MVATAPSPPDQPEASGRAGLPTAWQLSEVALKRAKESGQKAILVMSLPAPAADPLTWLSGQPAAPAVYWHDREGWEYAAAGAAHSIRKHGADAMLTAVTEATAFLRRHLVAEPSPLTHQMRFFGGFAFDPHVAYDDLWGEGGFADAVLVLPEALYIHREHQSHMLLSIAITPDTNPTEILTELKRLNDQYRQGFTDNGDHTGENSRLDLNPGLETDCESRQRWLEFTTAVLERIRHGELQKVVLSRRCRWDNAVASGRADPWAMIRALRRHTPACFHFAFDWQGNRTFIGASPERLVRLTGRNLDSECLAGTTGRGEDAEADRALAAELLASSKDRREHEYVVAGVREALQPLCRWLMIPAVPEVLTLATLQHLRTTVNAVLKDEVGIGEVLHNLHPTPAVGGWPREPAMRVIRETESSSRGWYAAPVGWIAPDAAEFAVGIRSGLLVDETLWLFAGAGLVDGSDPEAEWRETTGKLQAFLTALQ